MLFVAPACQVFSYAFADIFVDFTLDKFSNGGDGGEHADQLAAKGMEIHAISCAGM